MYLFYFLLLEQLFFLEKHLADILWFLSINLTEFLLASLIVYSNSDFRLLPNSFICRNSLSYWQSSLQSVFTRWLAQWKSSIDVKEVFIYEGNWILLDENWSCRRVPSRELSVGKVDISDIDRLIFSFDLDRIVL
jgi:hypothetical protein